MDKRKKIAVHSKMIVGWKKAIIERCVRLHILWIALSVYRNPLVALKALKKLIALNNRVRGGLPVHRYVEANKRYFWSNDVPGWPSKSFRLFIKNEFNRIRPFRPDTGHLLSMVFAVTNRCALQCEHCFEWQNLDSEETLSLDDLKEILRKFQNRGIDIVQLSGGEPLNRLDDVIELMRSARSGTDFWLLTSGYGLSLKKAERLKKTGLTGVNISLDHWNEKEHNRFRNNSRSFYWVKKAARNCRKVDLAVSFSLCAVKSFITLENLWKYVFLAKEWGAGFVRILEPRKVGRFTGKDVELQEEHVAVLKDFYLTINSNPEYRFLPIVTYPGFRQRLVGCFGAGDRYLYVDSIGDLHACPFCQHKVGNVLTGPLEGSIQEMRRIGCHKFMKTSSGENHITLESSPVSERCFNVKRR
jgi:MoaA/NifB/PqqE/SkfB family radical SAM enzyme